MKQTFAERLSRHFSKHNVGAVKPSEKKWGNKIHYNGDTTNDHFDKKQYEKELKLVEDENYIPEHERYMGTPFYVESEEE